MVKFEKEKDGRYVFSVSDEGRGVVYFSLTELDMADLSELFADILRDELEKQLMALKNRK